MIPSDASRSTNIWKHVRRGTAEEAFAIPGFLSLDTDSHPSFEKENTCLYDLPSANHGLAYKLLLRLLLIHRGVALQEE